PHVFPNPSLEPVSHDRVSDPSRDRQAHAEPRGAAGLAQPQKQEMVRVNFTAALLDVNKFRALAQPLSFGEGGRAQRPLLLGHGDRKALPPLGPTPLQHLPTLMRLHSLPEAMRPLPANVGWLIRPLAHESLLGACEKRSGMDSL